MKKLLLLLLLFPTLIFSQMEGKAKPVKITTKISNCLTIVSSNEIIADMVQDANVYYFNVHNQTTGAQLTLSSNTNTISFSQFSSIITYNSDFTVRVRVEYGAANISTQWSKKCKFSLENQPETTKLVGIKCGSIIQDFSAPIYAQTIFNASCYTFYVTNATTGQAETIGCQADNFFYLNTLTIGLNPSDALVIQVSYTVNGVESTLSKPCKLILPKIIPLIALDLPCGSTITNINDTINATTVVGADCYTFYVTNLTTGQSANTGCINQNYFTLASLGINFYAGNQISISVGYTIGKDEIAVSDFCDYNLSWERRFCHTILEDHVPELPVTPTQKSIYNGTIGNYFTAYYSDNDDNAYYAPALWQADEDTLMACVERVLLDLDAFLVPNVSDPSCGNPTQRMSVSILPYPQIWVDSNSYSNALAVAGQATTGVDINYLGQGCYNIPNVQLYNIHGGYGDNSTNYIGTIYINPAISNYNFDYDTTTFTGFDFYSVFLHEMTHILGIQVNDYKFKDHLHESGTPMYNPGLFDCGSHPNLGTMKTAGCANVNYIGSGGNEEIFAPATFQQGSSLSHFPDVCGSTVLGNNVMNPGISPGQMKRCYEQREVSALQDLGYNLNSSYTTCNYTVNNTPYIIGNHDGLVVQNGYDEGYMCDDFVYTPLSNPICGTWPFIINPLANDVNANIILEAVVKTNNSNGVVNIITNGTQIEFTASVPGIYTIGYIPGDSITGREGLPTYIQIWVPSCGDADLDDVTCNDDPNCNQICFNDMYSSTLLRGDFSTSPNGFSGPGNSFTIKSHYSQFDTTSAIAPNYSSVFFFVDTDVSEEYSISFDRSYQEYGSTSIYIPDPEIRAYAYLAKSSDMMGLFNQSDNQFSSLPASIQLLYQEDFTNNNYNPETASYCFTADDDYDMIFFYSEFINNFTAARRGHLTINNLEFMKKEFEQDLGDFNQCIPNDLTMGVPFCAVSSANFDWVEASSGATVSTGQIYAGGNITTPLNDDYTLTMSYPTLPINFTIPVSNVSCTESYSIAVDYEDCCGGPANVVTHPLTPSIGSISRTYGSDADADASGALYYAGGYSGTIFFGTQNASVLTNTQPNGFIVKIQDTCADWLVNKPHMDNMLEIANNGRLFYSSRHAVYGNDEFAELDPATGANIWDWNISGQGNFISDFVINNVSQEIIITGQSIDPLAYGANVINSTNTNVRKIFILRLDFNGLYLNSLLTPTTVSVGLANSNLAVDNTGTELYNVSKTADNEISIRRMTSSTLLDMTAPKTLTSSNNLRATAISYANPVIFTQLVYDADILDGSTVIATATTPNMGILKSNIGLVTSSSFSDSWNGYFFNLVGPPNSSRPNMQANGGDLYYTYNNNLGELITESRSSSTFTLNWSTSHLPSVGSWASSKGIKHTPIGTFTTGAFYSQLDVDQSIPGDIINATDPGATCFYGIKLDNSGGVTAMTIVDNLTDFTQVNNSTKSQNDNHELFSNSASSLGNNISIYPNPGKDIFTIDGAGEYQVEIINLTGKIVLQFNGSNQTKFDLSEVNTGMYFAVVRTDNTTQIIKLMKE